MHTGDAAATCLGEPPRKLGSNARRVAVRVWHERAVDDLLRSEAGPLAAAWRASAVHSHAHRERRRAAGRPCDGEEAGASRRRRRRRCRRWGARRGPLLRRARGCRIRPLRSSLERAPGRRRSPALLALAAAVAVAVLAVLRRSAGGTATRRLLHSAHLLARSRHAHAAGRHRRARVALTTTHAAHAAEERASVLLCGDVASSVRRCMSR